MAVTLLYRLVPQASAIRTKHPKGQGKEKGSANENFSSVKHARTPIVSLNLHLINEQETVRLTSGQQRVIHEPSTDLNHTTKDIAIETLAEQFRACLREKQAEIVTFDLFLP